VSSMAPNPNATARASIISDLPFMIASHSPPEASDKERTKSSTQEPRPGEIGDRSGGDRDPVGEEQHRRLAPGGARGEPLGAAHRQDLAADDLDHHDMPAQLAGPDHHRQSHQTADQG